MTTPRGSFPLRITIRETGARGPVVVLEGHLSAAGWDALCEVRAACGGRPVAVDLSGLRFVDPEPARRLAAWGREGVLLRGGSGFVRELLRAADEDIEGALPEETRDAQGGNP